MTLWLSRLYWTTSEHVVRSSRTSKGKSSLWLGTSKTWVSEQAIRPVDSARAYSYGLMQVHRLTLRLVLRRLFHPLTLLLPVVSVLLFFDLNLLDFASPLAIRGRSLPSSLTERRQRKVGSLRTFGSVCRRRRLSRRRLVHSTKTVCWLLVGKVPTWWRKTRMTGRRRLLCRVLRTVEARVSQGKTCGRDDGIRAIMRGWVLG